MHLLSHVETRPDWEKSNIKESAKTPLSTANNNIIDMIKTVVNLQVMMLC